ncbi:MAG: AAA family ATPase [Lachnospiraceae bacterium]|nr:AAA family ATPase [Lachnospiraceae bacterium]
MGIYLNPGNELFQKTIHSEIYIDKTMLLKHTNELLGTRENFLAVSRPRRFGKTTALDMLNAYYGRANDSRDLFLPYQIAKESSFGKYLNQFDVIQLNVRNLITESENMRELISYLENDVKAELKEAFPDIPLQEKRSLAYCLERIYASTKVPFVFLIDEWDAVFRVNALKNNLEEQAKYLDFLRNLLKDRAYVALAYMTGILPIKKYGEHSALNMFVEYSMTNQGELSEFTGFTEGEVRDLCEKYEMSYSEMKRWYDGYQLTKLSVYNPRSVVMAMTRHTYDSYWTKTETYEALKVYIEMNMDGLRDAIVELMAGNKVEIDTNSFLNDMVTFSTKDDVLTLLIHLGYLTYDFRTGEVWIPNQEIMGEFATTLKILGWSEVAEALRKSNELLRATLQKDSEQVAKMLEDIHQSETSIMAYNDENALASVISIAYYMARRDYDLVRELPSGKGFADVCFLPKKSSSNPAMIVELKVDQGAEAAIAQIKERNYVEGLRSYQGKVLLVGISYDRKSKRHSCQIEEIEKR